VTLETLLVVGAGAVLAPPLGVLAGPVLGVAEAGEFLRGLAGLGLALLFFPAAVEIDLRRIGVRPLRLGAGGWASSLVAALALGGRVPTFDRAPRVPVGA
jgi:Kef-type K+ transport system membrane component KefB